MPTLVTKLTIAALLAAGSLPAQAAPGNGIRLGGSEGRLHPFVELEGLYDSNVWVGSANAANTTGAPVGDVIIHVRPGLTLSVPGESTSVDASATIDFAQYLGVEESATKDLSKVYASADLALGVNKKGVVSLEVNDTFSRSNQPQAPSLAGYDSNYNLLEVKVPWRPGGGAMTLNLNGAWGLETYADPYSGYSCDPASGPTCSVSSVSDLNYNQVTGGAGVAWKFLPRTSAVLDGSYFQRLPTDELASPTGKSTGYHVQGGVTGLVTPHLAATLTAGYGSVDSSSAAFGRTSSWLATAEGEWLPTETASVKLGYAHDLGLDPISIYTTDRIALTAKQLVMGKVSLLLTASWELLGYSPGSETTTIVQVSPVVDVEVTRWLKAELAYAYIDRSSSTGDAAGVPDYTKNQVWLRATATY